jgi:hypothetical protein
MQKIMTVSRGEDTVREKKCEKCVSEGGEWGLQRDEPHVQLCVRKWRGEVMGKKM